MAKVLMIAREILHQGPKVIRPGDTFAANSIGDAKRLMRQNLARPKSVVAPLNRALEAQGRAGAATGKYQTK